MTSRPLAALDGPVAERERPRVDVERPRCPYCHEAVGGDDEKTGCGACMAWHHRACWSEHGSCSACGATEAAGAPAPVIVRPEAAPARSSARAVAAAIHYSDRTAGWFVFWVGVANALLWGGFLLWWLAGGPDMVELASFFFALGTVMAFVGLRAVVRSRAKAV